MRARTHVPSSWSLLNGIYQKNITASTNGHLKRRIYLQLIFKALRRLLQVWLPNMVLICDCRQLLTHPRLFLAKVVWAALAGLILLHETISLSEDSDVFF